MLNTRQTRTDRNNVKTIQWLRLVLPLATSPIKNITRLGLTLFNAAIICGFGVACFFGSVALNQKTSDGKAVDLMALLKQEFTTLHQPVLLNTN